MKWHFLRLPTEQSSTTKQSSDQLRHVIKIVLFDINRSRKISYDVTWKWNTKPQTN